MVDKDIPVETGKDTEINLDLPPKVVFRGVSITLSYYAKKGESLKVNELSIQLKIDNEQ